MTMQSQEGFKSIWRSKLNDGNYRARLLYTLLFFLIVLRMVTWYLIYNESREGAVLNDPVLNAFSPVDLNIPIFLLIYLSIIAGLTSLAYRPNWLLVALQTYSLTMIFRMVMMYVTPLEVPEGLIVLEDPIVFFIGTGGMTITKDLFFSGHTSTIFILFITAQNKKLKYILLAATILVGLFVMLQKVHYTVDVLVAPFVAYGAYRMVALLNRKYIGSNKV